MKRAMIMGEMLLTVGCVGLAYLWVYNLAPADPIVPFGLMAMAGGLFVDLWSRLGE